MVEAGPAAEVAVRVDYEAGDRFRIAVRQHTLHVDQPEFDGGEDTAPTPTELFIASLAACVGFYVRRFLTRHGHPVDGLSVTSAVEYANRPYRVSRITLGLAGVAGLPLEVQESLLAVAARCTVHNTLRQPPEVSIAVTG